MNLKRLQVIMKDQLIHGFLTIGIITIGSYVIYQTQKNKFKKWYKTLKEINNDSRTDLFGE